VNLFLQKSRDPFFVSLVAWEISRFLFLGVGRIKASNKTVGPNSFSDEDVDTFG
jgi:hypothetical protein